MAGGESKLCFLSKLFIFLKSLSISWIALKNIRRYKIQYLDLAVFHFLNCHFFLLTITNNLSRILGDSMINVIDSEIQLHLFKNGKNLKLTPCCALLNKMWEKLSLSALSMPCSTVQYITIQYSKDCTVHSRNAMSMLYYIIMYRTLLIVQHCTVLFSSVLSFTLL